MQPSATVLLTDAHESVPEPLVERTCPDVPSEPGNVYVVNPATAGAWSVITPEVAPLNPTVVNVPAFGVVAPTVPLMLIDAVPVRKPSKSRQRVFGLAGVLLSETACSLPPLPTP